MNQLTLNFGDWFPDENKNLSIALSERPQERLEKFGVTALSDTELVAIVLQGNGVRIEDSLAIASRVIAEAQSISGLASWHPADYRSVDGIGRAKAHQLAAVAEIARRMMSSPVTPNALCNRAEQIAELFFPITAGLQVEKFWVTCLNRKSRLIKSVEVSSGTATTTLAHPREVFRHALRHGATAIVCVHNHPSGDPAPSAQDLHVTRVLREAAKTIDIDLLDHVILGAPASDPLGRGFYSFREAGLL